MSEVAYRISESATQRGEPASSEEKEEYCNDDQDVGWLKQFCDDWTNSFSTFVALKRRRIHLLLELSLI
jgi:hypothetical protein